MTKIFVEYVKEMDVFIAKDEFGNAVSFKSDRESSSILQASESKNAGPMASLLMALGACSGIDIVMILKKQRQDFETLHLHIHAEREQGAVPALWIKAHIDYYITGNVEREKANKAAQLSVEKYCSVAETLRRAGCEVTYAVSIK